MFSYNRIPSNSLKLKLSLSPKGYHVDGGKSTVMFMFFDRLTVYRQMVILLVAHRYVNLLIISLLLIY